MRQENNQIYRKKAINERIILEIIKELRAKNIDFVFLIFHPHWPGVSTLDDKEIDWRDPFLKQLLQENDVPYIWSKTLFQQGTAGEAFILPDGHPTTYFNKVVAEEIKRYALESP